MYFSKNSRYVLQKVQWLSHSSCILQPLRGNDRNLSVKIPADDPTKPPLRVNIPKDSQKGEPYTKLIHASTVHKDFVGEPRSRSLGTRPQSPSINSSFEDSILPKSESDIHLSKFNDGIFNDEDRLERYEGYHNTSYRGSYADHQHRLADNFSARKNDRNHTEESVTSFQGDNYSSSQTPQNNNKSQVDSRNQENSTESDDSKTLYIIIDVPEREEEKLADTTDSQKDDRKPPPTFIEDDFTVRRPTSTFQLPKAPRVKMNWQKSESSNMDYSKGRSRSLTKLPSYKSETSKGSKMKFEVHEIDEAATYVFHLKFKKPLRKSSSVGCVPEKEVNTRAQGMNYNEPSFPEEPIVGKTYRSWGSEVTETDDQPELIKYPEFKWTKQKFNKAEDVDDDKTKSNKWSSVNINASPQPTPTPSSPHHVTPKESDAFKEPPVEETEIKTKSNLSPLGEILNPPTPEQRTPLKHVEVETPHIQPVREVPWGGDITPHKVTPPRVKLQEELTTDNNAKVHPGSSDPVYYRYCGTSVDASNTKTTSDASDPQYSSEEGQKARENKMAKKPMRFPKKYKKTGFTPGPSPTINTNKSSGKDLPKPDPDRMEFRKSASVINIACESLSTTTTKFCPAFPPILSEAMKGRGRNLGFRREGLFHDKWSSKINFRPKDFGINSKCSQVTSITDVSENSILFPKMESKFNCDALFCSSTSREEVSRAGNVNEDAPKISDNMVNVANENLTEDKGKASVDSLTMMKKVKEIIDFDLNNAIKIFEGREENENERLSSVVVMQENGWEVDTEELAKCAEIQKTAIGDEINLASIGTIGEDSHIPKYLPGKKENDAMMKLKTVHSESVVTYNPTSQEFFVNKKDLENMIRLRNDNPFKGIFGNYNDPVATLDSQSSETAMEMRRGDSILVFDEETQSWKVDYSILEKREKRKREEEELTKRSEFILETIEKLENEQFPNISKPSSRDRRIFDYTTEEWKVYNPEKKMRQNSTKSKYPFKESDAEEIRKKNSDLYEDLFVVKKKTQMNKEDKESSSSKPGAKSCQSKQKKEASSSNETSKGSGAPPTTPPAAPEPPPSQSGVPPNQPEIPATPPVTEAPPVPKDENFWESFLNMDILPKNIEDIPKRPPRPPAEPPKVEVPKIKAPPKHEEPKFRIPLPFREKKIEDIIIKGPKPPAPKVKQPASKIQRKEEPKAKIPVPPLDKSKDKKEKQTTPPPPPPAKEEPKVKAPPPGPPQSKEDPKVKVPPPTPPQSKEEPKLKTPPPSPSQEDPIIKTPPPAPTQPKEEPKVNAPHLPPSPTKEEPKVNAPSPSPPLPPPPTPQTKEEPPVKTPPPSPPQTKEEPKLKAPQLPSLEDPKVKPPQPTPQEDPKVKAPPPPSSLPKEDPKIKAPPANPSQVKDDPRKKSPPTIGSPKDSDPPKSLAGPKLAESSKLKVSDGPKLKPSSFCLNKDKNPDHYVSDNIVEISKSTAKEKNSKIKANKIETVKLNISTEKRMPSKITEINLNKKFDEKKESSAERSKKQNDSKKPPEGPGKNEKSTTENKTFYKNFEKYKTPFSDPDYEEKPIKINSDIESNPNMKKLDNWNKTLVLHDIGKPPENIESWLKDETDKMATLLLKVLQEAADGKPKKKPPTGKSKPGEKIPGKANPYDNIRKKQETTPENFLFKVRSVNIALGSEKKAKPGDEANLKPEQPFKHIPVQSAKTVKPPKVIEAVKIASATEKEALQSGATVKKPQTDPVLEDSKSARVDTVDPDSTVREILQQNRLSSELTEEIPGPEFLKRISSAWKMFPIISCQMTIATLFRLFQLVNLGATVFNSSSRDKARRHAFTKLFNKYGPIVNVQGPLSGNVLLIHKPEHLMSVFEQDSTTPVRSVFDSLEQSRREMDEKILLTGISTDWSKPEWNDLKKISNDPQKGCEKFFGMLEFAAESLVNNMRKNRNGQNHVSEDFMEEIKRWSLEGLCNVLFEKSFGFLEGRTNSLNWVLEPDKLYMAVDEASECLSKCERGFQTWRLMATPSSIGLGEAYRTLSGILSKQLYQAEVSLRNKGEHLKDGVLFSTPDLTFLESILLNDGMTPEEITCNLVDILVIGSNALNSALGFLLYNLAQNVKVQKKLLKELKEALPEKNTRLDYHKLHSLKYLQACVKESLRLHMPVPIVFRVLQNDVLLSNYVVPKGTYVVMDQRVSCMKEQIFDDPEKFLPERWLSEEKWMQNIHPFNAFPFCHGPRAELVKRVVEMQLWSCAAKIVRNFDIEYHFGEIKGTDNLITFPDKPLKLNFNERDS